MKVFIEKNPLQNTSYKVQSSIGYTPEGTNPVRGRLTAAADATIAEVLSASISTTNLCRRPVEGGVKRVPVGSTDISWIV